MLVEVGVDELFGAGVFFGKAGGGDVGGLNGGGVGGACVGVDGVGLDLRDRPGGGCHLIGV